MKKLLVYAENIERASFFSSLCRNLSFVDLENSIFITDKYSVYKYLNSKKMNCIAITRGNDYALNSDEKYLDIVRDSINYKRGILTLKQGIKILGQVEFILDNLSFEPDGILIFNGESFIDKYLCERYESCRKLYFEVGNFPNRMFVDPKGVNAKSTAFFDKIKANEKYHSFSYAKLMEEKKAQPPQAKLTIQDKLFSWFFNLLGIILLGYPYTKFESPICKGKMFISSKLSKILMKKYQTITEKEISDFIFVPLQVSSDTQILFNSDIDNDGLIENAIATGSPVIIKFHPAERNFNSIRNIYLKYRKHEDVYFASSIDTPTLIDKCKSVFSINSNVGLEAILQQKEVKFLGRTIYSDFDFVTAVTYLKDFLVELQYPVVKNISKDTEKVIYERFFC